MVCLSNAVETVFRADFEVLVRNKIIHTSHQLLSLKKINKKKKLSGPSISVEGYSKTTFKQQRQTKLSQKKAASHADSLLIEDKPVSEHHSGPLPNAGLKRVRGNRSSQLNVWTDFQKDDGLQTGIDKNCSFPFKPRIYLHYDFETLNGKRTQLIQWSETK